MKTFKIILKNNQTKETSAEKIKKITFSEAVVVAYTTRNKLGFDWDIVSIKEAAN